jgi:hypothetical protein
MKGRLYSGVMYPDEDGGWVEGFVAAKRITELESENAHLRAELDELLRSASVWRNRAINRRRRDRRIELVWPSN